MPPCCPKPIGAVLWSTYFAPPNTSHYDVNTGIATISSGAMVYLNGTPTFDISLLIVEGSLVFDHCFDGMELAASSILITGAGVLQIGKSSAEFPLLATIKLRDWPSADPDIANGPWSDEIKGALLDRGLVVANGGTLRLYGRNRGETWTRLGATAAASDTTITMAGPALDLEVDDEIVIASTDFDQNLAEVSAVTSIGPLVLTTLQNQHYGVMQDFEPVGYSGTGAWDVDERAEVGLLNRNVKIVGEQAAGTSYDYGHVFFCRDSLPTLAALPQIEISWVEFENLGVGGVEARYPVHFHGIDTASGDPTRILFIEYSSVHDTFNRGIVVHETSEVRVANNVVFKAMGHGIYLEDRTVKNCDVLDNLSLVNWLPPNPEPSAFVDREPGNITLRSLNNNVQGNAAAGSAAYGIYLELYDALFVLETGDEPIFAHNSAHSCQEIGIFEDNEFNPEDPFTFTDSRVWKCREHGMWIRSIGKYTVDGLIAADCRSGFYPASKGLRGVGEGHQILNNGLFVGETDNWGPFTVGWGWEEAALRSLPQDDDFLYANEPNAHTLQWDTLNGVEIYDGFVEIQNCRFAEFEDLDMGTEGYRWAAAITQVAKQSTWINDPRNVVRDLEWGDDVDRRIYFRPPPVGDNQIAFTTIVDEDDSIGNGSNVLYMPDTPFLAEFQSSAVFDADAGTTGLNGYYVPLSNASYGQLAVRLNAALETWLNTTYWRRVDDPGGTPGEGEVWECASVPTATNEGGGGANVFPLTVEVEHPSAVKPFYRMTYDSGHSSGFPANLTIWYRFAPDAGRVVFLEIPYDQGTGSANGRPSAVKYWNEDRDATDVFFYANPSNLLTTSLEQAWSHFTNSSGKKVLLLKMTSIELTDFPLLWDGTETRFEVYQ